MSDEALREIFVRFSAEVEGGDKLEHLNEQADHASHKIGEASEHAEHSAGLFKGLGEAIEGVAAVFAGSELISSIGETTRELAQLAHLSEQTGISAEQIEFYGFVVGQTGGDVDGFNASLSSMQRALSLTDAATSPQTAALKSLGIETQDAHKQARDMSEILPEVFDNFGRLKNPAEEAAVATRLFGRSGLALLPVLRQGSKGFEKYRKQFEATGGAAPEQAIERAKEYEKVIKRMGAAFGDLKTTLVNGVLPSLTHLVEEITDGAAGLSRFLKGTTAADHAVVALAAAFAGPLLGALRPFLGKGLKFLAIYAAVDDLLAFLEGKQSLIGDALNAAFGDGTADKVRAWVLDAKNAFTDFVASADATADALASSTSTWTEKALASIVGMFRDASQGFPAFRAGFASTLDGMQADMLDFVIAALAKWDSFVSNLKIPPILKAAAALIPGGSAIVNAAEAAAPSTAVDTSALAAQAASLRQAQADRFAESQAALRGRNSNVFGTAAGGDAARQLLAGDDQIGKGPRTGATPNKAQAAEIASANQTSSLAGYRAQGYSTSVDSHNEIHINLPVGVSKDAPIVAQVKQAVAEALADNNRVALQQLTQRGAK